MTPQEAEALANAAACVQALAIKNGLSVEIRIGGETAPAPPAGSRCGCVACDTCLAELAAPEMRRAVLLNALRLAWRARPTESLGAVIVETNGWLPDENLEAASDVELLRALVRVREYAR